MAIESMTPEEYRKMLAEAMSEKQLSQHVFDAARKFGWLIRRDATFKPTHTTAGFPDLTMVRAGRLIFAELKTEGGTVSDAQCAWINALRQVGWQAGDDTVICCIWHPRNWLSGEIEEILR